MAQPTQRGACAALQPATSTADSVVFWMFTATAAQPDVCATANHTRSYSTSPTVSVALSSPCPTTSSLRLVDKESLRLPLHPRPQPFPILYSGLFFSFYPRHRHLVFFFFSLFFFGLSKKLTPQTTRLTRIVPQPALF